MAGCGSPGTDFVGCPHVDGEGLLYWNLLFYLPREKDQFSPIAVACEDALESRPPFHESLDIVCAITSQGSREDVFGRLSVTCSPCCSSGDTR